MYIGIPETIARASGLSEQEMLTFLALMLYDQEKLSLGHASRLANMSQSAFLDLLAEYGIVLKYDVDDLKDDLENLREQGV
ncbi:MAG: UPF0175 family protein [Gammaproteobacteria bacterium]|nr:UPF0175 family protein [Gammaproteobacteria bacterium]MDH5653578.1 UPF0175 family protein [Gammaproteobacteria bacterium]